MLLYDHFEKSGSWLFRRRGILPLLLIPAMFYAVKYSGPLNFMIKESWWLITTMAISYLGLMTRFFTIAYSAYGTSGGNTEEQIAESLNITGIYSLIRNPLYTGNFIIYSGPILFISNLFFYLLFVALFILYYERIVYTEEIFLKNKFGKSYLDWAARTPAFIPDLYFWKKWQKNSTPFNFTITFRRELPNWAGLPVLFVVLIAGIGLIQQGQFQFSEINKYTLIVCLVIYLVYQIVKKTTRIMYVRDR